MDYIDMDLFEDILLEDDLDILDVIDLGFPRKMYERQHHFEEMDDLTFFKRFRLLKETVIRVLELIEEEIEYPNDL